MSFDMEIVYHSYTKYVVLCPELWVQLQDFLPIFCRLPTREYHPNNLKIFKKIFGLGPFSSSFIPFRPEFDPNSTNLYLILTNFRLIFSK